MLQYMRKNANSAVVWLIIGAIAVVFIFFGVGGSHGGRMITVNGEEVSYADYNRMVDQYSRSLPGDSPQDAVRMARVGAVRQLISNMLTLQFGRALGLEPSDRAVAQKVAERPEFQVDGRFDKNVYLDMLEAGRISPALYEKDIRDSMLAERSTELVILLSRAGLPEMKEMFHFDRDLAEFEYAFFPSDIYREGLKPSDSQLTEYYGRSMEAWRKPASMKVEYVEIIPADLVDQIEIAPAELEEYYHDNSQRFARPETVDVSHILIRFPRMNPDQAEREQTLEQARAVYERAKTEDFAALAAEVSQDPMTASKGGELGAVSRNMTFESLEEAAFNAPVGEIVPPVETPVGYHILKVTGRREAGTAPLDEVKDQLMLELKNFKSREAAVAKLEDLIIRAETSRLADAAASLGLQAMLSDTFTEADPPAFFENDAAEVKRAFSAPLGKTAEAVEKETRLTLYEPVERRESFVPPLDEIKPEVTEAWINYQAVRKARETASAFLARAAGEGWNTALTDLPASAEVGIGRNEPAGRLRLIGEAPFDMVDSLQMLAAVYSVAEAGQVSPHPVTGALDGRPGVFALTLTQLEKADDSILDEQAGESEMLMWNMERANLMYDVWNLELFELSKNNIKVPAEFTE